ncbi:MAG TPA: hypothetical protein PKA37_00510 [Planctomycetota bacterium]|jgi:hypothetical protein|nr:hypothetical protein [Planctomycetota bacterium]
MGYRPPTRPDPILIGPDAHQHSVVLTGDRISWFGSGAAPRYPRTVHLAGRRGLLVLPRIHIFEARQFVPLPTLPHDVGACLLVGTLPELLRATASLHGVGRVSFPRIIALLRADNPIDPLDLSELCSLFLRDDRHRLGWLLDPSTSSECLTQALASGFPIVTSAEITVESLDRSILRRFFGRPSEFSPGSLGDVLLKDPSSDTVIHSVIAGRLLLRDAQHVGPRRNRDTLTDPH